MLFLLCAWRADLVTAHLNRNKAQSLPRVRFGAPNTRCLRGRERSETKRSRQKEEDRERAGAKPTQNTTPRVVSPQQKQTARHTRHSCFLCRPPFQSPFRTSASYIHTFIDHAATTSRHWTRLGNRQCRPRKSRRQEGAQVVSPGGYAQGRWCRANSEAPRCGRQQECSFRGYNVRTKVGGKR